jgi:Lrp/AsnC family transcriptional regulator for asnA, asnC and gidA
MSEDPTSAPGEATRPGKRRIDAIDKHLIALLQKDGRTKYTDLARTVGISEALARLRVQRLRREGIIQIVAVTDPLMLGFSHEAMIGIQARSDVEALVEVLAAMDEVDFLVLVAGEFDILLEVVTGSDEEFLSLIHAIRRAVDPGTMRVLPYLKTRKQEYAWGVR